MNKLEFIEDLKKNMPQNLNEIETAKYIYIKLGKEKAFDERYFFGNTKVKRQMYQMAERTKYNTDSVAKNRKIICVSLSYLYRDILKEFGINSIVTSEGDHKYGIIILKDGTKIKADLQLDLCNIQTKCKTEYFGTKSKYELNSLFELSESELLNIDKKIGYVERKEDYKDNAIEGLKEKVKDKTPNEALDIIFNDQKVNQFENDLEFVEMYKYYRGLFNKTIQRYIDKKVFAFNCYRQKEDDQRDYTMCVYSSEENNTNVYIFSKKNNRFVKVELDKIDEMEQEGLVLGVRQKEQGVKKLKKIIRRSNEEKYEKTFE